MKYFCKLTVIVLVIIISICGCSNKSKNLYKYDNNISAAQFLPKNSISIYNELDTITVPFETSVSRIITIKQLKENFGLANIVRYNKGRYYSIDRLDETHYLLMLYNNIASDDELILVDGFVTSKLINKNAFNNVTIEKSKKYVFDIDCNSLDFGNCSYHRFSDSSVIRIEYTEDTNNNYFVSNIQELDNKNSVTYYLIDKDLELIT